MKRKEEALRVGQELLKKMPELNTEEKTVWSEEGAGHNFMLLCALLKGNAIPAKNMCLKSDLYKKRRDNGRN